MPHVHSRDVPAGLAFERDIVLANLDDSFWVATTVALHIFLDEALKQLFELPSIVCTVDYGGARSLVIFSEGPQLTAKVLDNVCISTLATVRRSPASWRNLARSKRATQEPEDDDQGQLRTAARDITLSESATHSQEAAPGPWQCLRY